MNNAFGSVGEVKFTLIEKTLTSSFKEHFPSYTEGLVRSEPGEFVSLPEYGRNAEKLRKFQLRNDDVWVITFPKCGTTWTQELVWMIMNNCDEEGAKIPLKFRSPFLEFSCMTSSSSDDSVSKLNKMLTTETIDQMPSPRIIKSHLPFYLLPPKLQDKCKVVYTVRNPKDVIVSDFFHHRLLKSQTYTGNIDQFAEYFMDGTVLYSPFFSHVLEAWAQRNHPNMLFMFYEDMKRDLRGQVERVSNFLGKKLSEDQLTKLTTHLRFENFAKNEAVNYEPFRQTGFNQEGNFIRKGETGDWKNHFSQELNHRVDKWMENNLTGSDLKFVTEL